MPLVVTNEFLKILANIQLKCIERAPERAVAVVIITYCHNEIRIPTLNQFRNISAVIIIVTVITNNTEYHLGSRAGVPIAVVASVCWGGVRGASADRMTVGIGMIPRGEVGLIFANVGAGISVDGHPLIEPGVYTAVVLMVMVTTVLTPPWLAMRLKKVGERENKGPGGTSGQADDPKAAANG